MIHERLRAAIEQSGMDRRYRALESRERLLLHIAGGVVIAAIMYAAAFSPAYQFRETSLARYALQLERLEWMRAHQADARRRDDAESDTPPDRSLLTLVDATAREAGVRLTRYRPESDGSVNVVIQQQSFNDVLRWTGLLVREGLAIVQVAIDAEASEGMVNATLTIR